MKISTRQLQVLKCIYTKTQTVGYPPTIREIGDSLGLASTSTVHGHLERLERDGYIKRDPAKTRAMEITPKGFSIMGVSSGKIPLLGKVAAGQQILAVEDANVYYSAPDHCPYDPTELFMLEINDDSMINAGILDGDLIIVRRQSLANNGEIVVAVTDDQEATCKTFFKHDTYYVLRPENDTMDDIYLPSVSVLGKVIGLRREYT